MKQRAGAMFQMLAAMNLTAPVEISAGLGKLYFDLAGAQMPEQMEMLLKISNAQHLIYGSDYPYVPAAILLKKKLALDAELSRRNLTEKIYSSNAKKILGN